jgi:hypothetical protein
VPYIDAPIWAKVVDRLVLTVQYLACLSMGLLAIVADSSIYITAVGGVILATSIPCMVGSVTGRWEAEAIGLWPLAGALLSVLVILGVDPTNVVWWTVLALVAAVLRQWLRLLLQLLRAISMRRQLESLEA